MSTAFVAWAPAVCEIDAMSKPTTVQVVQAIFITIISLASRHGSDCTIRPCERSARDPFSKGLNALKLFGKTASRRGSFAPISPPYARNTNLGTRERQSGGEGGRQFFPIDTTPSNARILTRRDAACRVSLRRAKQMPTDTGPVPASAPPAAAES